MCYSIKIQTFSPTKHTLRKCVTTSLLIFPQKTSLLLMLFSNRQFVHFIRDKGKMIIHSLSHQPWLTDNI